ncbi:MAG: hypothetical protein IK118_01605 [Clostridia bacterium]|nr:hypothetical protein [Clostridia bacterium]
MRQVFNINQGWLFSQSVPQDIDAPLTDAKQINLPYTWPAAGENAYKGKCVYRKEIPIPAELHAIRLFLSFGGVANTCTVYLNEKIVGIHKGGFTSFRFEITDCVVYGRNNAITVVADNSDYSAMCGVREQYDLFGGVWGDVDLVIAGRTHFALDENGSDSIYINTRVSDGVGKVAVVARISNPVNYDIVSFTVYDAAGARVGAAAASPKDAAAVIDIDAPAFWQPGSEFAYLYKLRAKLLRDGDILDEREVRFGFRRISVSGDGVQINSRNVRLRGVSYGQDGILPQTDHTAAIAAIRDMGANAVRLVNFYQNEAFFDLCDKNGIVVRCELPLELKYANEESAQNLVTQYEELARAYYNHPCVCFIAADSGGTSEGARAAENVFDALKKFDKNRLCVSSDEIRYFADGNRVRNADAVGLRLYDGENADSYIELLDRAHIEDPGLPVFVSEYGISGCAAYHSSAPVKGDNTEEYHALFHEKTWINLAMREFIRGCFAAELYDTDYTLKGLLCADAEQPKDAFWFYRSQWATEKFVKIAGEHFANRVDKKIELKVYSNCSAVMLSVNGKPVRGSAASSLSGVFIFNDVRLVRGKNVIRAVTEEGLSDEIVLVRKKNEDPSYVGIRLAEPQAEPDGE